jgi:hypothetical protein
VLRIVVDITDHGLISRLQTFEEAVDEKIHAVMKYQGIAGKSYMQRTAPWTDRTGNARQGLSYAVSWNKGKSHEIRFWHRMSYGILLETRWAGRYAIILPTIQKFGPETMRMLSGLFARLNGGGL